MDPVDNICKDCDSSCRPSYCTIPLCATCCTECASMEEFLLGGSCVAPTICPNGISYFKNWNGLVAIYAYDKADKINSCMDSCSQASTLNLVKNSSNVCKPCATQCLEGQCWESDNPNACLSCSSPTEFL